MLYLLLSLLTLIPVLAGVGAAVKRLFGKAIEGLSGNFFSGILCVTVLFTVLAFITPLTSWVEIITLIVGLAFFFYLKVYTAFLSFLKAQNFWFYLIVTVILVFASGYPFILDYFGYYLPTVKWIAEIGLVQGISNLDLVLGQMSFWHVLQAGFSHFTDPFMRLNAVILTAYLIYIFEKKTWAHLILFPFLYLFVQAPSPDLPAIVLSLVVLQEIFDKNTNYGWFFALSVFAFAIKPTLIWLPVFSLLYVISGVKRNFISLSGGLLIAVLFVFKNIWTFGFPVFPVQVLDLGFDWKPHAEILQISSDIAYRKSLDMQFSVAEIHSFSLNQFLYEWLTLPLPKGLINVLLLLSLLVFFIFCILEKQRLFWLLFVALIIKTALVLMFSAQYRFFLDVFFVLAVVLLFNVFKKNSVIIFNTALSLVILLMISVPQIVQKVVPSFRSGTFMTGFSLNQLIKPAYFRLEKYQTHQIGNLNFNIVEAYFYTFDTPLPAITPFFIRKYYEAGIFPQLKGTTLKDGFIWKRLSETDRQNLAKIIREMELEKYGR